MILLDTHVWIWLETDHQRIPDRLYESLREPAWSGELAVSAISCWELSMLIEKNRLDVRYTASEFIRISREESRITFLDLSPEMAILANQLPGDFHGDPADRMIVASAMSHSWPIATVDEKIRAYPHIRTL